MLTRTDLVPRITNKQKMVHRRHARTRSGHPPTLADNDANSLCDKSALPDPLDQCRRQLAQCDSVPVTEYPVRGLQSKQTSSLSFTHCSSWELPGGFNDDLSQWLILLDKVLRNCCPFRQLLRRCGRCAPHLYQFLQDLKMRDDSTISCPSRVAEILRLSVTYLLLLRRLDRVERINKKVFLHTFAV